MAASSQIGNIDQKFFPFSIYYVKLFVLKLLGSSKGVSPRKTCKNSCASHDFQQSFGNRIANIAFAQGSQNLQ